MLYVSGVEGEWIEITGYVEQREVRFQLKKHEALSLVKAILDVIENK